MRLFTVSAFFLIAGCATGRYDCQLGQNHNWSPADVEPSQIDEMLQKASATDRVIIRNSGNAVWFSDPGGSFLACIPGTPKGPCRWVGRHRESGCGQSTYEFSKTGQSWSAPEFQTIQCTCDP